MKFYLSYDGKAHIYSQYAWIYRRVLGHFRRGVPRFPEIQGKTTKSKNQCSSGMIRNQNFQFYSKPIEPPSLISAFT